MDTNIKVLLRDFDGTQTIYPVDSPLPKIINTANEETGILITRQYLQTDELDSEGRVVYLQSHL